MALPLGPFPYILTDGTLADANQVMANFNLLLNGVNGLAPLGVSVPGQTSNVRANLAAAGASVTVTADIVNVATALNGTSYTLVSYSQAFNGATTGAGGMDTGTMPTSGFVALYAIYNPTAPAVSILGTNAGVSSPAIYGGANMPAGYTASALLTVLPTNATPALKASYVRGKNVSYSPAVTVVNVSASVGTPTAQSISGAVPPNAVSVSGMLTNTAGSAPSGTVSTLVAADSGSNGLQYIQSTTTIASAALAGPFNNLPLATPQTIYYTVGTQGTGPSATIQVTSYALP